MKPSVLVIGGGAAGLTAALRLSKAGVPVRLIEERDHLGGRLGNVPGVFFGWHHRTRSLFTLLQSHATLSFSKDLAIEFTGTRSTKFRSPLIPGPLHGVLGLALFQGLSARDRFRALNLIERSWEGTPPLPLDLNSRLAKDWLTQGGQSQAAQQRIWNPLSRFLLGDELSHVSADLLVQMCTHCFLASHSDSLLAIPPVSLPSLILPSAISCFQQWGGTVQSGLSAQHLVLHGQQVKEVRLHNGKSEQADWYILAIPHSRLTGLLPERALTHYAYFDHLSQLSDVPTITVEFVVTPFSTSPRLLLLSAGTFHWIVCSGSDTSSHQQATITCVATGLEELSFYEDIDLVRLAKKDIERLLSGFSESLIQACHVIREPHGFLSLTPGVTLNRPLAQGPLSNLLLAGEWTDTSLPSSLEGAILSGERCAKHIMDTIQLPTTN